MCVGGQRDSLFSGLGCSLPQGTVNLYLMQPLRSRRMVAGRGESRERKGERESGQWETSCRLTAPAHALGGLLDKEQGQISDEAPGRPGLSALPARQASPCTWPALGDQEQCPLPLWLPPPPQGALSVEGALPWELRVACLPLLLGTPCSDLWPPSTPSLVRLILSDQ